MKNLAIVLHTCDSYERLWEGWAHCWNKFQMDTALDRSPIYFMNEEIQIPSYMLAVGAQQVPRWTPTGPGQWSDRLIRGLANIPEAYILYMQEDFWLKETLHDSDLNAIMYWIRRSHAVRIMGSGQKLIDSLAPPIMDERLRRFAHRSPHFFGHAATVWYKPHLLRCLGPNETPWQNERTGNERCWAMDPQPIHYHYPFEWYQAVHKNVWRTTSPKAKVLPPRSDPGTLTPYGKQILKEMQDGYEVSQN